MDIPFFTRSYLDSLSTAELIVLADKSGIDIPRDLERVFIIEELLEWESERDGWDVDSGAGSLEERHDQEAAYLPKQYNITYIDVLIRDPLWAFTFWEIKAQDRETYEKADDFGGYHLRVCPADENAPPGGKDRAFTIPVEPSDTARYLGFPPEGGCFKVELRVFRDNGEILLSVSRPFTLPKLLSSSEQNMSWGELETLSGIDELPVLRNIERLSRLPQGQD